MTGRWNKYKLKENSPRRSKGLVSKILGIKLPLVARTNNIEIARRLVALSAMKGNLDDGANHVLVR
jgi:hypothetical protein